MSRILYDTSNSNALHAVNRHQNKLGIMESNHFRDHMILPILIWINLAQIPKTCLRSYGLDRQADNLNNLSVTVIILSV